MDPEKVQITSFDRRRDLLIPGDKESTLDICHRHFLSVAREAIKRQGRFSVALAGGSTPKALYGRLREDELDWTKVFLFWGDERSVPPTSDESNYKMAIEAGLGNLPIPESQIFRMNAEDNIEENALSYEKQLHDALNGAPLDLVILGMGEDGHTASLFPQTEALKAESRSCVANYVPQKNTWRMTLTFDEINRARAIAIYVLGDGKKHTVLEVLTSPSNIERYPIQHIGTEETKALWILDEAAASELMKEK